MGYWIAGGLAVWVVGILWVVRIGTVMHRGKERPTPRPRRVLGAAVSRGR